MTDSDRQEALPPLPTEFHSPLPQQLVIQLRRIGDELITGAQAAGIDVDNDSTDDQSTVASSETETESGSSGRSTPEDIIEIQDDTNDGESSNDRRSGNSLPPVSVSAIPRHLQSQGDSFSEFRSPKKRKVMSSSEDEGSDYQHNVENEESDSCSICFEQWTTSGSHRLCSLKCGHLFGQSCIDKWLKGQGGKCPQCNCKAKRQDIRVLYAKSVKALDMSERDSALEALEREKETRRKVELDAAQMRLQYQLAIAECGRLRQELEKQRAEIQLLRSRQGSDYSVGDLSQPQGSKKLSGQFVIDKTIKIWDAGKCRVMAYCPSLATLVVSQPSASPLFPGFGVKKISCVDFKTTQYLTIHSKDIRDVAFSPTADDGLLLSCALDKTVKITNILSNSVVQTYESPMPVWSCTWNSDDKNYFYSGLQNGTVLEYDIRNTSLHVNELNKEGSRSPCVSLEYICKNTDSQFRPGGVLVGQLDKISFYEKKPEDFRLHLLPLEGSLTSLNFESSTRHFLATFRPTAKHFTVRHQMCELTCTNISADPTVIDNLCSCNVVQTFHGGHTQTILSKSILLPHPEDSSRLVVCAGDESSNSVYLWDSSTGETLQKLNVGEKVLDLISFSLNGNPFLLALTDKQLKVHKW